MPSERKIPYNAAQLEDEVKDATSCILDGTWTGGIIRGDLLLSREGAEYLGVTFRKTSGITVELEQEGDVFEGKLDSDGRLHWSDGDIWDRCDPEEHSGDVSDTGDMQRHQIMETIFEEDDAAEEASKKAAEEEAAKKNEEENAKKAAEEEAAKKTAEANAKKAAEEAAAKKA